MPLFEPDKGSVVLADDRAPKDTYLIDLGHQPWQWSPTNLSWIGPAYEVHWTTGDEVPPFESDEAFIGESMSLFVAPYDSDSLADVFLAAVAGPFGGTLDSFGVGSPSTTGTAATTGSGVAFLVVLDSAARTWPTPGVYPDPQMYETQQGPLHASVDVTTLLGDLIVDGTFTFPPDDVVGDGETDYYWLDLANRNLYGPKGRVPNQSAVVAEGKWPAAATLSGFQTDGDYEISGNWTYKAPSSLSFDGHSGHTTLLFQGGLSASEPTSADIPDGYMTFWYETTVGSTAVHFKGKDAAGTVKTATINLT